MIRDPAGDKAAFNQARNRWLDGVACDHDLNSGAVRVAVILWGYFNVETLDAWPAIDTMAEKIGVNRTTVIRGVNALIERQWLTKRRGTRGRSTRYTMAFGYLDLDGAGDRGTDATY